MMVYKIRYGVEMEKEKKRKEKKRKEKKNE
jgi:hypothetical protein